MSAYCDGIGHWSSQCQLQRALGSLPPGQGVALALLLILVCLGIAAALFATRDR